MSRSRYGLSRGRTASCDGTAIEFDFGSVIISFVIVDSEREVETSCLELEVDESAVEFEKSLWLSLLSS